MKTFRPLVLACWIFILSGVAAIAAASVTNVKFVQQPETRLVSVTYDLAGGTCSVSLLVSSDNGTTYNVPVKSVTGAVGNGVAAGTGKQIIWDAGTDWAGQHSDQMKMLVRAWDMSSDAGITFAPIPGGTYQIGNLIGDSDLTDRTLSVTLSQYDMAVTVTTKAQWDTVRTWASTHGYKDLRVGEGKASNHPVHTVDWYDVMKWANAASEREGLAPCYKLSGKVVRTGTSSGVTCDWNANGYRLPTDVEWEVAARGGLSGKRFPTGDTISHSQANYNASSYSYDLSGPANAYHPAYKYGAAPYTSPVGSFAANGYGLYDMDGNVFQWCWGGSGSYVEGTDPRGTGSSPLMRGGAWLVVSSYARCAHRNFHLPTDKGSSGGFRLARAGGVGVGIESASGSVDTIPPVLSLPANLTVSATSETGAIVIFSGATATDNMGMPTLVYSPASGSLFPIGTTTVTASATDSVGNVSSGTFTVTVKLVSSGTTLDLGNIVGGGDGKGNQLAGNEGMNGIDPASGSFTSWANFGHVYYNKYNPVPKSSLIDGVFVLGSNKINSASVTYTLQSGDDMYASFDFITNNRVVGGGGPLSFAGKTYSSGIGMHGGAGITFDLRAVRTMHGISPSRFESDFGTMSGGDWKIRGYVVISNSTKVLSSEVTPILLSSSSPHKFSVPIPSDAEFLTLMAGVGGDSLTDDHGGFGDAKIYGQPLVPVTISAQPSPVAVTVGSLASFSVTAAGSGPLSYQWRKDGAVISGATASTYTLASAQLSDAGSYDVVVTNSVGSVTSNAANLSVFLPFSIVTHPVSVATSVGNPATFSVTATGPPPLSYQWRKAGVAIAGATASSYSLASVQTADAGAYSVTVTSPSGSLSSNTATLSVSSPVVITKQPVGVSGIAGASVTLTVTATGSGPLSYQWYRDGVSIPLANLATYALGPLSSAKTGAYTVKVSNAVNAVTSSTAHVTLNGPPVIVTPPASATVTLGGAVTLVASVQSGANFTYQWRKNGVAIGTSATRTGSTAPASVAYGITAAKLADEGDYTVVATNAQGSVESLPAKLQLDIGFVSASLTRSGRSYNLSQILNNGSVDLLAAVPSNDILSVNVRASGTIQYSWAWASLKGGGWIPIAGQATSALDFAASGVPKTPGWFGLTVTVGKSIKLVKFLVSSFGAPLVVVPDLVITTQPADLTLGAPGGASQFSVVVTGTAPITYQWRKGGQVLKGKTASTLPFASISASDAGSYDVVMSNPNGSVVSKTVTLSILSAPVITAQPASVTVNRLEAANLSVAASGSGPLSYQWRLNGVPVSNGKEAVYGVLSAQAVDAGVYDVVVSNSAGSVMSLPASLVVNLPVEFTSQPASLVLNPGGSAQFSVSTTGTQPITYQWRRGGEPISGATGSSLVINGAQAADAGLYDVVASNPAGSVVSNVATLGVNRPVTILTQPSNVSVSLGGTVSLSVVADGTAPLTYQWRKAGVPVAGANGATFTMAAVQSTDEGAYDVVVTNPVGSVVSGSANVQVNLPPTITSHPAGVVLVSGMEASFSVVASGAAPFSYQWRKGGVPIAGALGAVLNIPAAQPADAGVYDVVVTNSAGSATSNPATLEVNVAPAITRQPASLVVNSGTAAVLSVVATGTAPLLYEWRRDGVPIGGQTSSTLSIGTVQLSDAGGYDVLVTNIAGSIRSDVATLQVKVPPVVTSQPEGVIVDVGALVTLRVAATGTGTLGYQWRKGGVAIPGATAAEFRIESAKAGDAGGYDVWVSGDAGGVGSRTVEVGVNQPLVILKPPLGGSVEEGGTWPLAVEAVGTGALSYKWSRDGAVIPGATGASYGASVAGVYVVVVSDTRGSLTSAGATVQVTPKTGTPPPPVEPPVVSVTAQPVIVAHPVNVTVDIGARASLQASVKCAESFWYQWKKNGTLIGTPVTLAGQGDVSVPVLYSLASCTSGDEGLYSLAVSDTAAGLAASTQVSRPAMIRLNLVFGDTRLVKSAVSYDLSRVSSIGGSVDLLTQGFNTSGGVVTLTSIPMDDVLQVAIRSTAGPVFSWRYTVGKKTYDLLDPGSNYSKEFKVSALDFSKLYYMDLTGTPVLLPPGIGIYKLYVTVNSRQVGLINFNVNPAVKTVNPFSGTGAQQAAPISLSVGLQSLLVPEGKAADFYVGVSGPVIRYTWYKTGVSAPVCGPSLLPYFILDPVSSGDAGEYRVEVIGPLNTVESGPVRLSVCPPGD